MYTYDIFMYGHIYMYVYIYIYIYLYMIIYFNRRIVFFSWRMVFFHDLAAFFALMLFKDNASKTVLVIFYFISNFFFVDTAHDGY